MPVLRVYEVTDCGVRVGVYTTLAKAHKAMAFRKWILKGRDLRCFHHRVNQVYFPTVDMWDDVENTGM